MNAKESPLGFYAYKVLNSNIHYIYICTCRCAVCAGAQLLAAADRVLLVQPGSGAPGGPGPSVQHLLLPPAYAAANWPLRLVAPSADGEYIAAVRVFLSSLLSSFFHFSRFFLFRGLAPGVSV